MSRLLALTLAGVSALALNTGAAPSGQAAPGDSTSLTPVAATKPSTSGDRTGNWCC